MLTQPVTSDIPWTERKPSTGGQPPELESQAIRIDKRVDNLLLQSIELLLSVRGLYRAQGLRLCLLGSDNRGSPGIRGLGLGVLCHAGSTAQRNGCAYGNR